MLALKRSVASGIAPVADEREGRGGGEIDGHTNTHTHRERERERERMSPSGQCKRTTRVRGR